MMRQVVNGGACIWRSPRSLESYPRDTWWRETSNQSDHSGAPWTAIAKAGHQELSGSKASQLHPFESQLCEENAKMNTRIALGLGLSLTLGSAVAGTLIYGQDHPGQAGSVYQAPTEVMNSEVAPSPETIALWKATAVSTEHHTPKVPI